MAGGLEGPSAPACKCRDVGHQTGAKGEQFVEVAQAANERRPDECDEDECTDAYSGQLVRGTYVAGVPTRNAEKTAFQKPYTNELPMLERDNVPTSEAMCVDASWTFVTAFEAIRWSRTHEAGLVTGYKRIAGYACFTLVEHQPIAQGFDEPTE